MYTYHWDTWKAKQLTQVSFHWIWHVFVSQAVASSCWSVLKQKRQHMKVRVWGLLKCTVTGGGGAGGNISLPEMWCRVKITYFYKYRNEQVDLNASVPFVSQVSDGFIAHFYSVCEQIGPVLAWGFLGPKGSLHDLCCFFKVRTWGTSASVLF